MRLAVYGAASTAVAIGVALSAFSQRANFYSASVYLAQSNACLMILTNLLVLLSIVFGHGLQRLFYGPLRAMEVEQIYEKAWYAVTETCLAMTIFRDEFDVRFIIMFGVLLFVKCFSWIGGGRVEFMEQQPPDRPILFHVRLASSLVLLCAACGALVWHAVTAVLERGKPNMMVMFAFEFAILLITSTGILARYVISLVEKWILHREAQQRKIARAAEREARSQRIESERQEIEQSRAAGELVEDPEVEAEDEGDDDEELDVGGWEEKGTWVFYSELCTDFLKLLTYLFFFSIVLTWYGLPLHIIRDVYLTLRSFITRIRDFVRYRRATAHMNSRYPDASAEEVEREHVCIICREEMRPWTGEAGEGGRVPGAQDQRHRAKKLPCGHVLHFACLRSWLERQQRCPTCRRPVLDEASAQANGNANPQNPAAAGQQNGLAFQAQLGIGPFGVEFGLGGGVGGDAGGRPPIVQQLMDIMNQQQQQQQQPNPADPNPQPQAPQNLAAPEQPQPQQQAGTQQRVDDQIQDQIRRLQQRVQQDTRNLQILQGFQTQPQLQQPQQAGAGTQPQTTAPGTIPTVNVQPTPTTPFPIPPNLSSPPLPQGLTVPPGWTVIPLTVASTLNTAALNPITPSVLRPTVLASRRGHRSYQENMRNWHASQTPTAERSRQEVDTDWNNRTPRGSNNLDRLPEDPTPVELSRADEQTRRQVQERIEALNDASRVMRETAEMLECRVGGAERLRLFGEGSVFPTEAQVSVRQSLEDEREESERKERERVERVQKAMQALEGLSGVAGGSSSSQAAADMEETQETQDKGKGVDRS